MQKLQAVQNFARRITSGTRKNDHITPSLKELTWLTVASELSYRSTITAFKCMSGCVPEYLPTQFIKLQLDLSYCGNYMRPIFLGFEHLNKL